MCNARAHTNTHAHRVAVKERLVAAAVRWREVSGVRMPPIQRAGRAIEQLTDNNKTT